MTNHQSISLGLACLLVQSLITMSKLNLSVALVYTTKCNLKENSLLDKDFRGQHHKGNSFVLQAKNRKVEDADAAAFAISRMPKSSTQPMVVVKSK